MNQKLKGLQAFKEKHPDVYEFILFNVMSNVATITNFVVLWIGSGWLFSQYSQTPFSWWIFSYNTAQGGLGGFLSFLLAYVCAQIVNFIVQRKIVFSATIQIRKVLHWYILTVAFAGIVSIWLPPYVISVLSPYVGGLAATIANIVNIVLQVVINYPMLKFVIMKDDSK